MADTKWLKDENNVRFFPRTHINSVKDDDGNTVGALLGGKADKSDTYTKTEVNNLIPSIQQDIVVGALPTTGSPNTIYRVPGTSSYTDWAWDGTQWVELATYNNAIDDVPTQGSNNLITSGGVYPLQEEVVGVNVEASIQGVGTSWESLHLPITLQRGKEYSFVFRKTKNHSNTSVSTSTSSSRNDRVDIGFVTLDYFAANETRCTLTPSGDADYLVFWNIGSGNNITVTITSSGIEQDVADIRQQMEDGFTELSESVSELNEKMAETINSPEAQYYNGMYMLQGTIRDTSGGQYALAVFDITDIVGIEGTIFVESLSVTNNYIKLWGVYESIEVGQAASVAGPFTGTTHTDTFAIPSSGKYLAVQCMVADTTVTVNYVLDVLSKLQKEIDDIDIPETDTSVLVSLPDTIYAVVGDTLQLFYRGMVRAADVYSYDVKIRCSKGVRYGRYFEYTPTTQDVGTTSFQVDVIDNNGKVIGSGACDLVTTTAPSSPSVDKKILCFGDSLTNGGEWPAEAARRLIRAGGSPAGKELSNISFCGSRTKDLAGYFGAGGWTWYNYTIKGANAFRFQVTGVNSIGFRSQYTNNGHTYTVEEINITGGVGNILCTVTSATDTPTSSGVLTKISGNGDATITFTEAAADVQNPLWDTANNKMSFIPYANEYCGGAIDAVYVLLTWNGLGAYQSNFSSMMASVKTFADTLHTEFPNAKMKIMGIQVPNQKDMHGYGANGGYSDVYGMTFTAIMLNQEYKKFAEQDEYSSFVEYVDVASQFDSEYNMPTTTKAVNTRNSETEVVGNNGVHPLNSGYMQIADAVYRNIVANFCI